MKIKKLEIKGYKNLKVSLEHKSDAIALIGNNGSGKSNLLEALSIIFKNLYADENNTPFDYIIEYANSTNQHIRVEKKSSQLNYYIDDETRISIEDYLPKKVVAIYSGEEDRLWKKCFGPFYLNFVKDINKSAREGIMSYNQTPKMLYLNKYYWHISLLCLMLSDNDENQKFVKEILSIAKVNKIKFDFNKSNYQEYKKSLVLDFIGKIDNKSEYTLAQFKKIVDDNGYSVNEVYTYLYLAYSPKDSKIVNDIKIKFNDQLSIESLSEGEKKLLLLKSAFEFAGQEDCLFILDEPDAHIHINNKDKITSILEPYKTNRQVVITTHSPTVTKAIENEELFMMDDGEIIERREQKIIERLTGDFWNKHQQSIFLSSDKKLILLVEGKHDKIHIRAAFEKLSSEFTSLDFDIYSLGGEGKIAPFMVGLYEANLKNDITYVAIYDNDGAGNNTLNKAGFDKEVDNCGYRKLKENNIKHNHFFATKLIKPKSFTKDCTIETMYEPSKYQEAYREAMDKTLPYFYNKSIDDINKEIKDASKTILAEKSKAFDIEDFKNFRPLFSLLAKIITENQSAKEETTLETVYFNNAKGLFNPENETVRLLNESRINKNFTDSTKQAYIDSRTELLSSIQHTVVGDEIVINQDYTFDSPSGAAKFANGGNRNGWTSWKCQDGKSLKEKYKNE
jgi:predicted ATP-dependent endonuclease of OLD family